MKTARLSALAAWLMLSLIFGCSKANETTAPTPTRGGEDFINPAVELFGQATSGQSPYLVLQPHYHDIDLAHLCTAGGSPPGWATTDAHGAIAVTLNRANDFGQDGLPVICKPVFRWLNANNQTADPKVFYVTARDQDNAANPADYEAVKCAALYDSNGTVIPGANHNPAIEVAVCYQIRNRWLPGTTNPDLANIDWDIGVTILRWTGGNYTSWWDNEPSTRYDYFFPDPDLQPQYDENTPDIAFNYDDGDIYLVYNNVMVDPHEGGSNMVAYIMYRWYSRLHNDWSIETYAQSTTHNGYEPSIDIGWILGPGQTVVGIAYTAQYEGAPVHNGYHVCVSGHLAFPSSQPINIPPPQFYTLLAVRNPDPGLAWLDAGQPSLDIVQDSNLFQTGVVAYTQVTGADDFGPTTAIYVASLEGQLHVPVQPHTLVNTVLPPPAMVLADGMYPSIAFNGADWVYDEGPPQRRGPRFSVTFMAQEPQDSTLHPFFAELGLNLATGLFDTRWRNLAAFNPSLTGNFNMSDIPFIIPGISSAIVPAGTPGNYWAAWCDRTEMEPPPEEVWALYGFTD